MTEVERKPDIKKMEKERDVDGLIKALGDKDAFVRIEVAQALGRIGPRAAGSLIKVLEDETLSVEVRKGAAFALSEIGDEGAIEPLKKVMSRQLEFRTASGWPIERFGLFREVKQALEKIMRK